MPSNNFDRDIKGVPQIKTFNSGNAPLQRVLRLSNSASETGLNSARANTYGRQ